MLRKSLHFYRFLTYQNEPKSTKKHDFWPPNIWRFYVFFVFAFCVNHGFAPIKPLVLRVPLSAMFFENSRFSMCFQYSVFSRFRSSLFTVLVGSGDLQNRPWPFKKHAFAYARASFSKSHVFLLKNRGSKKTWFFIKFGVLETTQKHPKSIPEVFQHLIKKTVNSEEGLVPYFQVCHYTPGVKFAREGGDLGGCPTTFQHASSLSRRKVGG